MKNQKIKKINLKAAFASLKNEAKVSIDGEETRVLFPFESFKELITKILFQKNNAELIKKLCKYLNYHDLRYYALKFIKTDLNEMNQICFENLIQLFAGMPGLVKKSDKSKKDLQKEEDNVSENASETTENSSKGAEATSKDEPRLYILQKNSLTEDSKIYQIEIHRKMYNDCIVKLLKYEFDAKTFKKLLVKLPEKILPKMSNPLMLADFFTNSYNMGGLVSVLALNGLFVLISRFNLEYPNFYAKVYEHLDCSIFETKFKDRYFQLLDTFLLSTHLSIHIAAAFIKKLSRLSLFCPPGDLRFLVAFISNLIVRHQKCKVLISRPTPKSLIEDPFDVNTKDFNRCHAFQSSLWELKSLKSHYLPQVVEEAVKLESLGKFEKALDEFFENNSYEMVLEQEFKQNIANCSLHYMYESQAYSKNLSILKYE